MKKRLKTAPKFKSEDHEREFWAKADASKYFDLSKGEPGIFPNLKPTTESISIRLPKYLLIQIKAMASAKDVPYQSLMKILLADRVREELAPYGRSAKRGAK